MIVNRAESAYVMKDYQVSDKIRFVVKYVESAIFPTSQLRCLKTQWIRYKLRREVCFHCYGTYGQSFRVCFADTMASINH